MGIGKAADKENASLTVYQNKIVSMLTIFSSSICVAVCSPVLLPLPVHSGSREGVGEVVWRAVLVAGHRHRPVPLVVLCLGPGDVLPGPTASCRLVTCRDSSLGSGPSLLPAGGGGCRCTRRGDPAASCPGCTEERGEVSKI